MFLVVENVIQLNEPIISELVLAVLSLDDELDELDEDDVEVDEESEGAG